MAELSRRRLLRGQLQQLPTVVRLPWSVAEPIFIEGCTRCNRCIEACQTKIIVSGSGGYPQLNFDNNQCTFCGRCRDVCQQNIFDFDQQQPWRYVAEISQDCLTTQGIECRSCQDSCEPSVIHFRLSLNSVANVQLDQQNCTGCGACIRSCPTKAISLVWLK